MSNEKNLDNNAADDSNENEDKKKSDQQPLPFHNPLKPDYDKQITQEDLDNEQQYKEALSERD